MSDKVRKFEVIGTRYNLLGYVWARDVNHAWLQASTRYRCEFVIFGV